MNKLKHVIIIKKINNVIIIKKINIIYKYANGSN